MENLVLLTTYYVPTVAIVFIVLELVGLVALIVLDIVLIKKLKQKDQIIEEYKKEEAASQKDKKTEEAKPEEEKKEETPEEPKKEETPKQGAKPEETPAVAIKKETVVATSVVSPAAEAEKDNTVSPAPVFVPVAQKARKKRQAADYQNIKRTWDVKKRTAKIKNPDGTWTYVFKKKNGVVKKTNRKTWKSSRKD
jgi:outer membrane biosynthesis protein TonB